MKNDLTPAQLTQSNALERVKGFPIDADLLLIKVLKEYGIMAHDRLYHIIETMDKYPIPTAQSQRKKGKWLEKENSPFYCSVCGTYQYSASWEIKNKEYNFCPRCGADMRG